MTRRFCSPCFCVAAVFFLSPQAVYADGVFGKICRHEGYVVIQRGMELIELTPQNRKPETMSVVPGETICTKAGTAEVLYDNGSSVKVEKNSVVMFLPGAVKEKPSDDIEAKELCVRVAIGGISATIKPKSWDKTVFLAPQSRIALLDGELRILANESGDWQVSLEKGRALITELSLKLMWQALPSHSFRVEYVPRGLRITNMEKSTKAAAIGLYVPGGYEIVAEKGDIDIVLSSSQRNTVKEKGRAYVELPPKGTVIKELDPSEAVLILRGGVGMGSQDKVSAAVQSWASEGVKEEPEQAGPDN